MSRKITALLLAMLMLPLSAMNTIADENDPDLSIDEITFSENSRFYLDFQLCSDPSTKTLKL